MSDDLLLLNSTHSAPRLLINRLALFDEKNASSKRQEVEFKRGLNLIVGVDSPGTEQEGDLGGHSVGKTTFCRLLRYCLGETTFATSEDQKLIKDNFPHGWVGCQLSIHGQNWAVIKPIGRSRDSFAHTNKSIEDLFTLKQHENCYDNYLDALDALLPINVLRRDVKFEWFHLLSWLSRDQESPYRVFWDWRSTESESGSPKLPKPKIDGDHLLRAVLDLLVEGENALKERLHRIGQQIKQIEAEKDNAQKMPDFRFNIALAQLRQHFDISLPSPGLPLPQLHSLAFFTSLQQEIQKLQGEVANIADKLADNKLAIRLLQQRRQKLEAIRNADAKEAMSMQSPKDTANSIYDEVMQLIYDDQGCLYGAKEYSECIYVQEFLRTCEMERNGLDIPANISKERLQAIADNKKKLDGHIQKIKDNETLYSQHILALQSQQAEKQKGIADCHHRDSLAKAQWKILTESWDIIHGFVPNTAVHTALEALKNLENEKADLEGQLEKLQQQSRDKLKNVEGIFNALVGKVVGGKCYGKIETNEALNFTIQGKGRIGGDALRVVRTVLADLACLLYAVNDKGRHPGFLLHDSLRQSEMSLSWYNSFMKQLADITEENGGREAAPFQYIATSTMQPDKSLRSYIRKELASMPPENLLFKMRLEPKQREIDV